ncbi:uncharacterized protein LOC122080669 [Macadamia integrifolia]|uniref:uncharacterized protein LOC122080669 n=1 Tax=Macadamia integrifolia TaxID=60698 RepID=UPI001C4F2856|nr:uncharacterized protein LOC122080669 [Macadamia integrifolia]
MKAFSVPLLMNLLLLSLLMLPQALIIPHHSNLAVVVRTIFTTTDQDPDIVTTTRIEEVDLVAIVPLHCKMVPIEAMVNLLVPSLMDLAVKDMVTINNQDTTLLILFHQHRVKDQHLQPLQISLDLPVKSAMLMVTLPHTVRRGLTMPILDKETKKILNQGRSENGLYQMHFTEAPSSPSIVMVGVHAPAVNWHHCLGHPSYKIVHSVLSQFNIPFSGNKKTILRCVSAIEESSPSIYAIHFYKLFTIRNNSL